MAELHRTDIQQLLEQADAALEAEQLQSAYRLLDIAHAEAGPLRESRSPWAQELAAAIDSRLEKVREAAGAQAYEAHQIIEEALEQPVENFPEAMVDEALQRLYEAQLTGEATGPTLRALEHRVERRRAEARDAQIVQDVQTQIENYWAGAMSAEASGAGDQMIIDEYFKPAEELAQAKAAEHPHLSHLKILASQAAQRRRQRALAAEIYTSALQADQFKTALENLSALSDDALVPRKAPTGEFMGYITAREARDELMRSGRDRAHDKTEEYINSAYQLLDAGQPRAALDALRKWKEFDLFLRDEQAILDDIRRTEREIQREIQQQEQAEARAREAIELIEAPAESRLEEVRNAYAAWGVYLEARKAYPNAHGVETVRQRVVRELRRHFTDLVNRAQTAWQRRDIEAVLEMEVTAQQRYDDLQGLSEQVFDDDMTTGAPAVDVSVDVLLQEIARFANLARHRRADIQAAHDVLVEIAGQVRRDPEGAHHELEQMEARFGADILSLVADPTYEAVRAEVQARYNTQKAVEDLRTALNAESIDDVARAMRVAKLSAERAGQDDLQETDSEPFTRVYADLDLHHTYLVALRDYNLGNYQAALEGMEQVAAVPGVDRDSAQRYLEELAQKVEASDKVQQDLKRAEHTLELNPALAWRILKGLDPMNSVQRMERRRLVQQTRARWNEQIETRMQAWQAQTSIPLNEVEDDLRALQAELGDQERYEHWSQIMRPLIAAQQAEEAVHDLTERGDEEGLREAVRQWEKALDQAYTAAQKENAVRGLRQASKALGRLHRSRARQTALQIDAENRAAGIETLTHSQAELNQLAGQYPDDIEIMLWLAEVSGTMAQVSETHRERADSFERMQEQVTQVRRVRGETPVALEAEIERLYRIAQEGRRITGNMQRIDNLLMPNQSVADFIRACDIWQEELAPHTETFTFLARWWAAKREAALKPLYEHTGDKEDRIELSHVRPLAKILVLDPENTRGSQMLRELPRLENELRVAVHRLRDGLATAQGFEGSDAAERLANQRAAIEARQADALSMEQVLEGFRGERPEELAPHAKQTALRVKRLIDDLRDLGEALRWLDSQRARAEMAIRNEMHLDRMRATDEILAEINVRFSAHPVYVELHERARAVGETRENLVSERDELVRLVQAENYAAALRLMRAADPDLWRDYRLYETLEIYDPVSNERVKGWHNVFEFVEWRDRSLRHIIAWAEPFDIAASGLVDVPAPAIGVVAWSRYRPRIERALERGDFGAAAGLLAEVHDGPTDIPGEMPLAEALERAGHPPAARTNRPAQGHSVADRYRNAVEQAATVAGAEILRWVRAQRLPRYSDDMQALEMLDREGEMRQANWEKAYKVWEDSLQQIAQALGGPEGRLRGGRAAAVRGALKRAYQAYQICRGNCSAHPLLRDMIDMQAVGGEDRTNWLYREAVARVGYDPAMD